MSEGCSTCKFYLPNNNGGEYGLCRRYPPQVSQSVGTYASNYGSDPEVSSSECSSFPESAKGDWCGEYQERTSKAKQEQTP